MLHHLVARSADRVLVVANVPRARIRIEARKNSKFPSARGGKLRLGGRLSQVQVKGSAPFGGGGGGVWS